MLRQLPPAKVLYKAFAEKDSSFEGLFFAAVKTTGIFCRPTCTARKPNSQNVEYFGTAKEALLYGYRPCKTCRPLSKEGETPDWLDPLLAEVDSDPHVKLTDADLKKRGLEPNRIRRWFKKHHGLTFQAYVRNSKIGHAFARIKQGESVADSAFASGYESLSGFVESFKKTTGLSPQKSVGRNLISVARIPTPLGPMLVCATGEGICLLEFTDRRMLNTQLKRVVKAQNGVPVLGANPHFDRLNRELSEYFDGKRKEFTVPLAVSGTPFQNRAWDALKTIRYGETRSYQEQAEQIGSPSAVRAVARANGSNPIGIVVPCHRVIGKNGQLTGYGGGIWRKKYLLDLEAKFSR